MNTVASKAIEAKTKAVSGKGPTRELRRQGYVPAVIYGPESDSQAIAISAKDLGRALRAGHFYTTTQELSLDGKATKVLAKEIQRHPVTEEPLHVDFIKYNAKQIMHVNVMVRLVGEEVCPGIKLGGVLQLIETNIEVVCRADSIPEELVVDISELEIGDSVHLSSIKLPEGVKPAVTDRDLTIASIISTRTSNMATLDAEADAEAAGAVTAAAEVPASNQKEEEKKED
ncbi:MAG: 50S ribosomal protein L25 [Alphaproteobacteria bacterium CG_4_10_14_0_8_um_filter_53_9]|nr:MAG: 50S ribosomal protein L25 [Alphaproteobacteria bacterium CG_4_10_14_0_8_um_filter_53_9]